MKKTFISLFLVFSIVFSTSVLAYSPSGWAKQDIDELNSINMIPDILKDKDYKESITRAEFCHLVVNMYKYLSKNEELPLGYEGFADTFDMTILAASELGIINGYDDGHFYPDNPIKRQELAAIICRCLKICGIDITISEELSAMQFEGFEDKEEVSEWAYENVSFCLINEIIKGLSETEVSPLSHTSREQALVIINRCIKAFESQISYVPPLFSQDEYDFLSCEVSGDISFVNYENRALSITWDAVLGTVSYDAYLFLSKENFWYANEDTYVKNIICPSNEVTFKNMRAGKCYNIIINALDEAGNVIKTINGKADAQELYSLEEKEAIIFGGGNIYSKAAADAKMELVTVKVWAVNRLGEKYPSTLSFSVHKNISQIVVKAFDEIFNGEEKFPFKDGGAYAWRTTMSSGRYSHHNYGTAIDLNYNENYCIYKNGSYTGAYWKPYEDIYSFPADGEVVSIFAKYGFAWGGDEWSNPKDYMHFSYLEL